MKRLAKGIVMAASRLHLSGVKNNHIFTAGLCGTVDILFEDV